LHESYPGYFSKCIDTAYSHLKKEQYTLILPAYRGFICLIMLGIITGCASTPIKKPQSTAYMNSSYYQSLKYKSLSKSLPMPVKGVSREQLVDTWGNARSHGRVHLGIDILTKRGTPILSTTDGIVTKINTGGAGGKEITIVSDALSQHYYAHLDRFGKFDVGDIVQVGDTIGYVGNSGNATTDHLHYGIYLHPNRVATNPYAYLR
jgi:peptidoglycan LD-endopeptidase LytH